jgi:hypothetical protein
MGERGPAPPDDDTCLTMWEANVRGASLPALARAQTPPISVSTARRWRNRGRKLARDLAYGADGELVEAALRERAAAVMQETRRVLFESAIDQGNGDVVAAALAIVKSIEVEARVLGYAAPQATRADVNINGRRPEGPSPFTVDQVEAYQRGRAAGEIEA